MDIKNFSDFIKLIEYGTISKTADELYITQSALSKIIAKIEDELKAQLLNRTNKGVSLTKEGQIAYNYFIKMLNMYAEMKKEIEDSKENIENLKIEALPSIANYSLPCTLYKLSKKYKDMKFPMSLKDSSAKIVSDISDEIADIGFVSTCKNCEFLKIKYTKAYEEKIVLIASSKNRISKIKKEDLKKYNLIQYTGDDTINDALEIYLDNYKELRFNMEFKSMESVKKSVSQSDALSFLPYSAIKSELYRKEVKSIEIEGIEIKKDIYIARRHINTEKKKNIIEFIEKFLLDTIC